MHDFDKNLSVSTVPSLFLSFSLLKVLLDQRWPFSDQQSLQVQLQWQTPPLRSDSKREAQSMHDCLVCPFSSVAAVLLQILQSLNGMCHLPSRSSFCISMIMVHSWKPTLLPYLPSYQVKSGSLLLLLPESCVHHCVALPNRVGCNNSFLCHTSTDVPELLVDRARLLDKLSPSRQAAQHPTQ